VGGAIEEEELRIMLAPASSNHGIGSTYITGLHSPDKHNPAAHNDSKEGDEIQHAKDIQDDVSWARELRLLRARLGGEVEHLENEFCYFDDDEEHRFWK